MIICLNYEASLINNFFIILTPKNGIKTILFFWIKMFSLKLVNKLLTITSIIYC